MFGEGLQLDACPSNLLFEHDDRQVHMTEFSPALGSRRRFRTLWGQTLCAVVAPIFNGSKGTDWKSALRKNRGQTPYCNPSFHFLENPGTETYGEGLYVDACPSNLSFDHDDRHNE